MIESVELINWKAHGHTKLSFSKGPNILIGHMGAGKSSVMDAISFGLFGTFPGIKNKRVKTENLVRNRPEQSKSAKVKITFRAGGSEYIVEREVSAGSQAAKATMQKDGVYIQSQPQRVTEEIEKALMMDYDLFSRAVYSEQNRLDYFLELKAADRKKQIDNLLGLDRFAAALENNTSLVNRIKAAAEEGERTVKGFEMENQKAELSKLAEEEKTESERMHAVKKELEVLAKEKGNLGTELEQAKASYNRKNLLVKKAGELQSRVNLLNEEILKIETKKPGSSAELALALSNSGDEERKLKVEFESSDRAVKELQNKLGKLESEHVAIARDRAKKIEYDKELQKLDKNELSKNLEICKKELGELEEKIAHSTALKKEAEKWIVELKKERGRCPVCERDLDKIMREELLKVKNAVVAASGNEVEMLTSLHKKRREDADGIETMFRRISTIEDALKNYMDIEKRAQANEEGFASAKKESEAQSKKVEETKIYLDKINKKISTLREMKLLAERRDVHIMEKKSDEKKLEDMKNEIASILVNEDVIEELQKRFTLLSSETGRREAMTEALAKSVKDKKTVREMKQKEIDMMEKVEKDVKHKRFVVGNLTKFGNSLLETQALLRSRLISSVNEIMGEIWPELYPYEDYTGIELEGTESDYTLRLCMQKEGKEDWGDVEAVASGGERNIACLAMRIAFAMVLVPNLKWLILDEPTHNIDRQGIGKFVEVFNAKLPQIIEQVFIITHDEQMKQVSGGRIFIFDRDKAKGEQTQVSEE